MTKLTRLQYPAAGLFGALAFGSSRIASAEIMNGICRRDADELTLSKIERPPRNERAALPGAAFFVSIADIGSDQHQGQLSRRCQCSGHCPIYRSLQLSGFQSGWVSNEAMSSESRSQCCLSRSNITTSTSRPFALSIEPSVMVM